MEINCVQANPYTNQIAKAIITSNVFMALPAVKLQPFCSCSQSKNKRETIFITASLSLFLLSLQIGGIGTSPVYQMLRWYHTFLLRLKIKRMGSVKEKAFHILNYISLIQSIENASAILTPQTAGMSHRRLKLFTLLSCQVF